MEKLTQMTDPTFKVALNELARRSYQNAKEHGFWNDEDDIIGYLISNRDNAIEALPEEKKRIDRVISLFNSEKVALEHSELSERLETLRKDPNKKDEHCPEFLSVEIEAADEIIRLLDSAGRRGWRIGEAVLAKMKYNEGRPYMHGKKF